MAQDNDGPSWQMLTLVGMAAGVSLGAVIVLMLRREREGGGVGPQPSAINIWNMGSGGDQGVAPGNLLPPGVGQQNLLPGVAMLQDRQATMNTQMATVQLAASRINRLWYASGRNPWSVDVSVDGPPGSFAYVSTDPSALNPGFAAQSNVLSIAAGQHRVVRLQPGQDLYALASIEGPLNDNNVHVSIVASEGSLAPSYG